MKPISGHLKRKLTLVQRRSSLKPFSSTILRVYDQYNLCEMALSGNLKVLKLPMLQHLCEDLCLDAPVPPVRKKAPYLALLEEITKKVHMPIVTLLLIASLKCFSDNRFDETG